MLQSRSLAIGTQSRVVGEISARRIVGEGAIKGNLYALESVTLRSGAAVHGDVGGPRIVVEEGARLTGCIDMEKAPAVPRVSLPASGASATAKANCPISRRQRFVGEQRVFVLDEATAGGNPVVQGAGRGIGFMGQPVEAPCPFRPRASQRTRSAPVRRRGRARRAPRTGPPGNRHTATRCPVWNRKCVMPTRRPSMRAPRPRMPSRAAGVARCRRRPSRASRSGRRPCTRERALPTPPVGGGQRQHFDLRHVSLLRTLSAPKRGKPGTRRSCAPSPMPRTRAGCTKNSWPCAGSRRSPARHPGGRPPGSNAACTRAASPASAGSADERASCGM